MNCNTDAIYETALLCDLGHYEEASIQLRNVTQSMLGAVARDVNYEVSIIWRITGMNEFTDTVDGLLSNDVFLRVVSGGKPVTLEEEKFDEDGNVTPFVVSYVPVVVRAGRSRNLSDDVYDSSAPHVVAVVQYADRVARAGSISNQIQRPSGDAIDVNISDGFVNSIRKTLYLLLQSMGRQLLRTYRASTELADECCPAKDVAWCREEISFSGIRSLVSSYDSEVNVQSRIAATVVASTLRGDSCVFTLSDYSTFNVTADLGDALKFEGVPVRWRQGIPR